MANAIDRASVTRKKGRSLKSDLDEQVEGAETAFNQTTAGLSETAAGLAGDAQAAVVRKAEDAKQGLSGGLKALGGALRAAGDNLSESGQGSSSKLLGEAASGVERFAESLESKPLKEVFGELRSLGRNNAGSLFVGSMLAGVALVRLLKAADGDDPAPKQPASEQESNVRASDGGIPRSSATTSTAPSPTVTKGDAL